MRQKTGNRNRRKTGLGRRFFVALAVLLLFFVCLSVDVWKKRQQDSGHKREENVEERKNGRESAGKNRDRKRIRVLLSDTDQSSIFHQEVSVSGTKEFAVEKNGRKEMHPAGETVTFRKKDLKGTGKGVVLSCPKGRLKVTSIRRRQRIPSYRGTLKLTQDSRGVLVMNELSLGQYLYGVVPSEMSPEYPMEALKAQAVCARSYAWQQMRAGSYKQYGADVDDTTTFQVYNMAGEDMRTRKAVNKTAGQVLFHGNRVVTTYYYSTSWGYSATAQEVWGGDSSPCYPRKLQITEESRKSTKLTNLDLSDEKIFGSFITKNLCDTYDADSSWYRWKVMVTAEQLGAAMGIGTVKQIQVIKRAKSGLLQKIRVEGTGGRRTLTGQQDIRERLMVPGCRVEKGDGSSAQLSTLPSAAFLIQPGASQEKVYFLFTGGGFGHGTGMSQNGAAGMAEQGIGYREILMHYYSGCEIR